MAVETAFFMCMILYHLCGDIEKEGLAIISTHYTWPLFPYADAEAKCPCSHSQKMGALEGEKAVMIRVKNACPA